MNIENILPSYRAIMKMFKEDIDKLILQNENTLIEKIVHPSGIWFYTNSDSGCIASFHSNGGRRDFGVFEALIQLYTKPNFKFQRDIRYTMKNIHFVTARINRMKGDMTWDEFVSTCKQVAKHCK